MNVIYGGVRNVSWDKFSPIMEKGDRQKEKSGGPALHLGGGFLRTLKELHSNEGQWVDSEEGVQAQRQRSVGGKKLIYTFTATMV